jgi:hypothetical protein
LPRKRIKSATGNKKLVVPVHVRNQRGNLRVHAGKITKSKVAVEIAIFRNHTQFSKRENLSQSTRKSKTQPKHCKNKKKKGKRMQPILKMKCRQARSQGCV